MKHSIYSIYDKKAGSFGPIFTQVNDSCAIRHFLQITKRYPDCEDDFQLYCLGAINFDDCNTPITAMQARLINVEV